MQPGVGYAASGCVVIHAEVNALLRAGLARSIERRCIARMSRGVVRTVDTGGGESRGLLFNLY